MGNDIDEVARIVVRHLLDTDPDVLDISEISKDYGHELTDNEVDDVYDKVMELLREVRENFNEGSKND